MSQFKFPLTCLTLFCLSKCCNSVVFQNVPKMFQFCCLSKCPNFVVSQNVLFVLYCIVLYCIVWFSQGRNRDSSQLFARWRFFIFDAHKVDPSSKVFQGFGWKRTWLGEFNAHKLNPSSMVLLAGRSFSPIFGKAAFISQSYKVLARIWFNAHKVYPFWLENHFPQSLVIRRIQCSQSGPVFHSFGWKIFVWMFGMVGNLSFRGFGWRIIFLYLC